MRVKLPAAGVDPVQRWRGELVAEFGWLPVIRGPLPQQEQLTSMTGPCGWHTTQCRASVTALEDQRSEKYRHALIAVVSIGVRAGQLGGTDAWLSSHLVSHA